MRYIDIHTHQEYTSNDVIFVRNYYPKEAFLTKMYYYSIGIHPWYLDENSLNNELVLIEKHLFNKTCLAVGECGLDHTIESDYQLQKDVFIHQLKLAEKFKKPVIVHCVKAHQELIEILKNEHLEIPVVFHGFSKNKQIHSICLKLPNLFFSFGKSLLNSKITQANLLATPMNRIFLETDNSDADIKEIYQQAAQIKNLTVESLQKQLILNFEKVFNIELKEDNGKILA